MSPSILLINSHNFSKNTNYKFFTNSVDSVSGEEGMIITAQLARIVRMITSENSPCVKTAIATRLTGLKGLSSQTASVALNLKMSFFLVTIMNVFDDKTRLIGW